MGNTCSSKSHQSVDTSNQEKEKLNQNDIVPYACKDDKNSNKKDDKENINNENLSNEKNISQRNLSLNINKQNQSQKQSDKLEITLSDIEKSISKTYEFDKICFNNDTKKYLITSTYNCYNGNRFLMAFLILAESKANLTPLIPENFNELVENKKIKFSFFKNIKWITIEIEEENEKFPVLYHSNSQLSLSFCYRISKIKENGNQVIDLFFSLFEKAFSKFLGSYENLSKCTMHKALISFRCCLYDIYSINSVKEIETITVKNSNEKKKESNRSKALNTRQNMLKKQELLEILKFANKHKCIIRCCIREAKKGYDPLNDYILDDIRENTLQLFIFKFIDGRREINEISFDDFIETFDYIIVYNDQTNNKDNVDRISKTEIENLKNFKLLTTLASYWKVKSYEKCIKKVDFNKISLDHVFTVERNGDDFRKTVASLAIDNNTQTETGCLADLEIDVYKFNKEKKTWDLYEWITSNTDEIQLNCNIDKGTYIYVPNFSKIQHETINYSFAIYTPEDSQKLNVNVELSNVMLESLKNIKLNECKEITLSDKNYINFVNDLSSIFT